MTRHIRLVVLAAVCTAVLLPTGLSADQGSRWNPDPPAARAPGDPPAVRSARARARTPVRPRGGRRQSPGRRTNIGLITAPAITILATAIGYGYRLSGYYGYGYPGFYAGFYSPYFWGFGLGFGCGLRVGGYGYGYGYGPAYGYGYGQYPYPPYYYGPYYDNTGSARLQVSPRNTQVYIDGYFVGVVDNFDGNLQRLNVEAGEHELQLYLEGYRTFTQKVLFPRGGTLKVMHTMQPLGPGESAGLPPKPDEAMRARPSRPMPPDYQGPPPPERQGPPPDRQGAATASGTVR